MTNAQREAEPVTADAVAQRWLRAVCAAGMVPGRKAKARQALRTLLQQLLDAMAGDPFDPEPGWRVGERLIELRMADPRVLGATVRLLYEHLPTLCTGDTRLVRDQIGQLMEQLAGGFVLAARGTAMRAGEDMNLSMANAWERDRKRMRDAVQRARLYDPVSELPNRAFLRERLRLHLQDDRRDLRIGACLIRINGFADLANTIGHRHGDDVLQAVGERMRELQRNWVYAGQDPSHPRDLLSRHIVAHLGGEKFFVLVVGVRDVQEMLKLTDEIRRALVTVPLPAADDHVLRLRISAGIVVDRAASRTEPDAWLRDTHLALNWADDEPDGCAVYRDTRAAADLTRHRLAAALPAALDRGEFEPFFQPILDLGNQQLVGAEALARWRHDGQLLGPEHFIALAEQTGLIAPLGQVMLEQACHHASAWHARGIPLLVSVNLSARQLDDPGLIAAVTTVLDRTGLPAEHLQLEITESAAVATRRRHILHELDDLGIRLALDDFGTGYSSFTCLIQLPVTTVKLAGDLIAGLDDPDNSAVDAVVSHIIQLCHAMNITVTAEGIETETQYRRLRDLGCDHGQGFLFARPAPAATVTHLLRDNPPPAPPDGKTTT